MKLEVRCCCDPNKLWGFIDVEEEKLARRHRQLVFEINSQPMTTEQGYLAMQELLLPSKVQHVVLELASITYPDFTRGVAAKSHDYPIELLRLIPGFTEATPEEQERGARMPVATDGMADSQAMLRVMSLRR